MLFMESWLTCEELQMGAWGVIKVTIYFGCA